MDIQNIITIGSIVIASGAIKITASIIKEGKEAVKTYKADLSDNGKIDNPEVISKEFGDVIEELLKLQNVIKKIIPKFKTKK